MSKRAEFYLNGWELLAEPYHYFASGLDNIYLMSGVKFENTSCGPMVTIENLNGLHRAIGLHIVEKKEPMTGAELRFLRKQLELTQADLGEELGVCDQTIANYEKGKTKLGPADRSMRTRYLLSILPESTRVAVVNKVLAKYSTPRNRKLPDLPRMNIVQRWNECGHHDQHVA